ncbi:glycosyltransferase family 4 protein [Leucobacter sp. W1478]|uniref:glycosyltransferase family 4 protein n=1 Tax=Leucobacter sp. W1478 TaxID=3439065 RepID=UPI003F3424ED
MTHGIAFVRWHSDVPSGGNRYDDTLTGCLRAAGLDVREYPVAGSWPFPSAHDRERLQDLMVGEAAAGERHWLIDNILGSAAPETLRAATQNGRRITMLMHYFAADERGVASALRQQVATDEAAAVAAASTVIATSEWTANEVAQRYGRGDVIVAVPGVDPAQPSPGSLRSGKAPHLLWLGRVTHTKDPVSLIEALVSVRDLDWTAQLVGPDTIDPGLSEEIRGRIAELGLTDRVEVAGARTGTALESIWNRTDLLVHTARSEAYGMVVTEALARGIPSIVPTGTGAAEAQLGAGGKFPPGDPSALAREIRTWCTDSPMQERWRREALTRREALPTWHGTAQIVAAALER